MAIIKNLELKVLNKKTNLEVRKYFIVIWEQADFRKYKFRN